MSAWRQKALPISLAAMMSSAAVLAQLSEEHTYAGAPTAPSSRSSTKKPNSDEGRTIYHGKGFCHQCHGNDGYIERLPDMKPDMRHMIERMDPKPSDFRNPATLKSKNDDERFDAIKNGHRGTAMFPHQYLKDSEINDLLAYLSALRSYAKGSR